MKQGERQTGGSEQRAGEQGTGTRAPERQRARPAPGKVTRTGKLASGGNGAVQRRAAEADAPTDPEGGAPLDGGLRQQLEDATGFSGLASVRVHTGSASQRAAGGLGAAAFTSGQHIHFGAGQYNPNSAAGKQLIAHEVAHVVQQSGAPASATGQVGSAGDAHEAAADRFAGGFAIGMPVVQRLARGSAPSGMIQRRTGTPQPLTVEELAAPVRERLVQKRAEGTAALVAEVRSLRAQAEGQVLEAVNLAVSQTLTQEEQDALAGNTSTSSEEGAEATPTPEGGEQTPRPAANENAQGQDEEPSATPEGPQPAPTPSPTDAAPQNAESEDASAQEPGTEGQDAEGQDPAAQGDQNAPGQGGDQAQNQGGGGEQAGGQAATPAPMTTEQALQPVAAPPADERAFIQGELGFHESWTAMRGSTADRAARLFSANDLGQGLLGGGVQVLAGVGIEQLAKRVPVPGLGNMIGGGLSAYALFSNGGAGIRNIAGTIGEGFNWDGKGPWQIAADVVAMIKGVLDLIGNICNILSGLAYAFAAIAAVGGLLSVLFPPLAFLVPYIPTAINFGRMCGGVATVCMGISDLISPIPPVLRAIHILVSDQDPLQLAQQEQTYHGELQGAIASYSAAGAMSAIEGKGFNPVGNMVGGVADGAGVARSAYGDARAGNTAVNRAFGFEGGDTQGMRGAGQNNGERYFDVSGQQRTRLQENTESEQRLLGSRQDNAQEHRRAADEAHQRARDNADGGRRVRREAELAERRAVKREQRVEQSEGRVADAKNQQELQSGMQAGGPGGEVGNTTENARQAFQSNGESERQEPGGGAIERDQRGHVVLPPPPGSLQEVDQQDQTIQQLQQRLAAQQQHTQGAQGVRTEAGQRSAQLGAVQQTVDGRVQEHTALEAEHANVAQQNADVSSRTQEQSSSSDSGLGRAAEVLSPMVGPAQTVNDLVQRVPSNRFFDVSGTQQSLSQFVQGMEQITGGRDDAQEQSSQTQQVLQSREQQTAEADQLHQQTSSEGQELLMCVQNDQGQADSVAQEAASEQANSQQQEQTLEQQIQQAIQEREQKWSSLVGWAQQHYSIRQRASSGS
ncbi:eCIS core domain-containing protein [Haliangium ochraceum]|uniref:eCIS core domain-containing protein n=1 Tax=Haliangium ochraceum (strain DSM 14365 / JCM 11303 / SMP-2) TaxID=502025 RepID=D0LR57_HALO1|nr:DUF4157 domain-containing protein [Haliangium ochraceum]ACY15565.1 hypothetical protein Hoch_3059 [Haliangium ochraceum DSM 14365]